MSNSQDAELSPEDCAATLAQTPTTLRYVAAFAVITAVTDAFAAGETTLPAIIYATATVAAFLILAKATESGALAPIRTAKGILAFFVGVTLVDVVFIGTPLQRVWFFLLVHAIFLFMIMGSLSVRKTLDQDGALLEHFPNAEKKTTVHIPALLLFVGGYVVGLIGVVQNAG